MVALPPHVHQTWEEGERRLHLNMHDNLDSAMRVCLHGVEHPQQSSEREAYGHHGLHLNLGGRVGGGGGGGGGRREMGGDRKGRQSEWYQDEGPLGMADHGEVAAVHFQLLLLFSCAGDDATRVTAPVLATHSEQLLTALQTTPLPHPPSLFLEPVGLMTLSTTVSFLRSTVHVCVCVCVYVCVYVCMCVCVCVCGKERYATKKSVSLGSTSGKGS